MAVVALTATKRPNRDFPQTTLGGVVVEQFATVTTNADDSVGSAFTLFTGIPLDARLMPDSWINNDDLGTSTQPDIEIGFFAEDSQFTDDEDALATALSGQTAGEKPLLADHKNWGKQVWEYINGATADTGGTATLKITIRTAAIDTAGDVSAKLRLMMNQ